jgi:hypothetical protein
MNKKTQTIKQIYKKPSIILIALDNDISLVLESSPPFGPEETFLISDNYKYESSKV